MCQPHLLQADLIKCCSTLTGLSQLTVSCVLPPTSFWMAFTVMHTSSRRMKHFLLYMCCQTEVKPTSVRTRRLALYCSQGIVGHAGVRGGRDCCYTNTKAGTITFQVVLSLEVSVNLLEMLLFVQFKEHPVQTYNTKTIISTSAHFCLCYSSTRLPWGIWPWTWRVSGNVFVELY